MKIFAIPFLAALGVAAPAFAVDLRDATNRQILDELDRRLDAGGGTTTALATFVCDAFGALKISLVNEAGSQADYALNLGSRQACANQATPLAQRRQRITRLTLVALCDPFGSMKKLTLRPDGVLGELDSVNFGNLAQCLEQAGPINSK